MAWQRKWAASKIDVMALPKSDRPRGWQLLAVSENRCLSDDIPLSPSTEVERLTRERDEAIAARDVWFNTHLAHRAACDALGAANGEMFKRALEAEHRVEARQEQLRGVRAALQTAEATNRSLEERLAEAEKRWMMSDAQFADMEFLSIEGFLDWQRERRAFLTKLKEGQP